MSDFDVFDDSDHLPSDHLLNELESIKGILDDQHAPPAGDIPLLDDMVIGNLEANTSLLNLNRIFEEDDDEADPLPELVPSPNVSMPRFNLNTMLPPETEVAVPAPATAATPSAQPAAAPIPKPQPAAPRVRPDYSREVLIQELIDEFIPEIEAALHERLSKLDDATLKHWKKPG